MLKKRGRGWERAGMELTILCVCVSEEEEEYQSGGRWDLKSSMRALWQRNLSIKSLQSTIIIITKQIKNKKYVGCVRRPAVMLVTDAPSCAGPCFYAEAKIKEKSGPFDWREAVCAERRRPKVEVFDLGFTHLLSIFYFHHIWSPSCQRAGEGSDRNTTTPPFLCTCTHRLR